MGGHAGLLFGIHAQRAAIPLAMGDSNAPVEVALVEAGPQEPEATAPPPESQEPVPPDPVPPEPDPQPQPEPPPPDPVPTPEPPPIPSPALDLASPKVDPPPKPEPRHAPPKVAPALHRPSARTIPNPSATASTATGAASGQPTAGAAGASGNSKLRPRYNPRPDYPPDAKSAGQQGVVMISVEVDSSGAPSSVQVSRSSGFPRLDEAAVAAVRRWRFEPSRIGGIPVAGRAEVPIRFNLQNH